jgi:7TM-HD extracellular
MVTTLKYWGAAGIAALVCFSLHARDIATYKVGDIAQADITASVSFDVVNAQATAALKATKAMYVPAIYRDHIHATNSIARDFLADFDKAHSKFSSELTATFQTNINNAVIASPDFGYFLTEFNVVNKKFPVSTALAEAWARGNSGAAIRDQWLGRILEAMSGPVRPDELPPKFVVRKTIRLVKVKSLDDPLTLAVALHGHGVPATNVLTISNLRAMFRGEFPPEDQPVALALSQFLKPNCAPDPDLTQQARDFAIRSLVVADHYETGQVIVRQGQTIDAQTKAALDAFAEKLAPAALNQQIAAEHQNAVQQQQLAQQEQMEAQNQQAAAQLAQLQQQQAQLESKMAENQAAQEREQAAAMRQQAFAAQTQAMKIRERNEWLVAGLATVSALALLIVWRVIRRQRTIPVTAPAKLQKLESPAMAPTELAPFLAQTLKDAVVQGLAAQRAELIHTQRLAAAEIAELVHRLDQLQTPMQERLRAYQGRIQELQKELAERTEENRELLKMKIEMMRQQIESEQGQQGRVKLN